jgi:thioesterase domain-containing protein
MKDQLRRFPTLIELNRSSSDLLIFCLHPAGGGLGSYEFLAKGLEDVAKVYGLEDPMIYDDVVFADLPDLADYHLEVVRAVQSTGPYIFFGSCSAAPLGYELACQLHFAGEDVEKVVMFGAHDLLGFDPERDRFGFLCDYLERRFGVRLGHVDWGAFERMDCADVAASIANEVREMKVSNSSADHTWIKKYLTSLCRTMDFTRKYRASRSSLNIDFYKQPRSEGQVQSGRRDWCDWASITSGNFRIINHAMHVHPDESILSDQHVSMVVDDLKKNGIGCFKQNTGQR